VLIFDGINEEFYYALLTAVVKNETGKDKLFIFYYLNMPSKLQISTVSNEVVIMNDK
jgi:hypothetical protein